MRLVCLTAVAMLTALLGYDTSSGQFEVFETQPETFHVHGTVRTYTDDAASGAEVRFAGEKFNKKVSADDKGYYEIDLPVGLYTFTVQALGGEHLQEFRRPLFRVASQANLTLNASLERPGPICDKLVPFPGSVPTAAADVITCGGDDFFPVPSEDNVPFQLLIRYQTRRHRNQAFIYNSDEVPRGLEVPVFVAYNLFTLRAESVTYSVPSRALTATGNVVLENANGSTQHFDSITFKIENGGATPVPSEPIKY